MIYLALALLSFAVAGHIYVTRQQAAKTRRQILELKESVARLSIAEQNREAVRPLGGVSTSGFTLQTPKITAFDAEAVARRVLKGMLRP